MSEDWNTKYGTRRVRRDPPTLEEAIFAAVGITDDQQQQAEIAAALMGLPYEEVLAEVRKPAWQFCHWPPPIMPGKNGANPAVVSRGPFAWHLGNAKRPGTEKAPNIK